MKKILFTLAAVILAAGLAAGLAACSDSPGQSGSGSGQSSTQSTAQTGGQSGATDAQTGAQTGAQDSAQAPAQDSAQAPAQDSAQAPAQDSGQAAGQTAEPAQASADKTAVSLGVTKDAQTIFTPGVDWIKGNKDITVTMTLIENGTDVLRAVQDGTVDAGLGVDLRFMETFNRDNDASLVMVAPYPFATGIGLYSDKFTSLDAFPEGAKIAIMNDPMDMDRSLRMLRDAGFIVLDPAKDSGFSILDITDNPKKAEFVVVNPVQAATSPQEVDGTVISFGNAKDAGRDPKTFIIRDKDAELYPMGIVVKSGNETSTWAKALADTMLSEPVRARVAEHFIAVYTYFE